MNAATIQNKSRSSIETLKALKVRVLKDCMKTDCTDQHDKKISRQSY